MLEGSEYRDIVLGVLTEIESTQKEKIRAAGKMIEDSLDHDGLLHVFSTGHSHMISEELFYRTGGLVQVNPILDPPLMLHQGAMKSTRVERLQGYAESIAESIDFRPGEPIIIASNSGINSVTIEMALYAKKKDMKVIAITSVDISGSLKTRHPSGKKLMDLADIVIDNCVRDGDAVLKVPGIEQKVGAVSSIAGLYIAQRLIIDTVDEFLKKGKTPPIYMSANVPGGDQHNARLVEKYGKRIRGLY